MPPSSMDGIRNFKFTVPGAPATVLQLIDTDFWIDYDAAVQGTGQAELSLTLNSVWQHSDFTSAQGRPRRRFMEDRLKELNWDFVGKKGTLIIDEGEAEERTFVDITLVAVETDRGFINDLLEYSIEFSFPLTSQTGIGGLEIARAIEFLKYPHNLAKESERFDQAIWVKGGTATVTADLLTAPDGTLTADRLEDFSGANIGSIQQTITIPMDSQQYEYSVFLEKTTAASTFPAISLELLGGSPTVGPSEYAFDTDTGVFTLRTASLAADVILSVEALGAWWRVALRLTNNNLNSSARITVFPAVNTDAGASWIASTNGSVHGWGGQLSKVLPLKSSPVPYQSVTGTPTAPISFTAENYIVERTREDRAQFKTVFRAKVIRVRSGKGLENIRITAIKQLLVGASDLDKRQDAEAKVKIWSDVVGDDGLLTIDSATAILAHLNDALPSDFSLPDAITFDLNFFADFTT